MKTRELEAPEPLEIGMPTTGTVDAGSSIRPEYEDGKTLSFHAIFERHSSDMDGSFLMRPNPLILIAESSMAESKYPFLLCQILGLPDVTGPQDQIATN